MFKSYLNQIWILFKSFRGGWNRQPLAKTFTTKKLRVRVRVCAAGPARATSALTHVCVCAWVCSEDKATSCHSTNTRVTPWSFRWRRPAKWAQPDHCQNNPPQLRGLLFRKEQAQWICCYCEFVVAVNSLMKEPALWINCYCEFVVAVNSLLLRSARWRSRRCEFVVALN